MKMALEFCRKTQQRYIDIVYMVLIMLQLRDKLQRILYSSLKHDRIKGCKCRLS